MAKQRTDDDHATAVARPGDRARALRRHFALGLVAALGASSVALAQEPAAPAGPERHTGKLVFAELVTPDLAAAERFYGALFGWTFQTVPAGEGPFTEARVGGQLVAGMVQRQRPAARRTAWLTLIEAGDVEAADGVAVRHGAKLLFGPHDVADLGREAVLADPQGAVFAVFAASAGDPPEQLAVPGSWIWSSLITSDPDADAAFYKALFGYEVYPLPDTSDARHLILGSGDFARASVNPLPPERPDMHPRWLNYVRVEDASAMAAKVTSLGGQVLVQPRPDRHGGKIAVVADPAGALFGLMEWADDAPSDAGDMK